MLNLTAIVAAIAAGTALALMELVFGDFVNIMNNFSRGLITPAEFRAAASVRAVRFIYIFLGRFFCTYIHTVSSSRLLRWRSSDITNATLVLHDYIRCADHASTAPTFPGSHAVPGYCLLRQKGPRLRVGTGDYKREPYSTSHLRKAQPHHSSLCHRPGCNDRGLHHAVEAHAYYHWHPASHLNHHRRFNRPRRYHRIQGFTDLLASWIISRGCHLLDKECARILDETSACAEVRWVSREGSPPGDEEVPGVWSPFQCGVLYDLRRIHTSVLARRAHVREWRDPRTGHNHCVS